MYIKELEILLAGLKLELLRKTNKKCTSCGSNLEVNVHYIVIPETVFVILRNLYPKTVLCWRIEIAYFIYKYLQDSFFKVLCSKCQKTIKTVIPEYSEIKDTVNKLR